MSQNICVLFGGIAYLVYSANRQVVVLLLALPIQATGVIRHPNWIDLLKDFDFDCNFELELERDHLKTSYPYATKVVSVLAEPTP